MTGCFDLLVIGGGAAGLLAALRAEALNQRLGIAVLERQPRVGKKLLATGNGRCNLTNRSIDAARYHGTPSFLPIALTRYPPERVLEVFARYGLLTRAEPDGRVYPAAEQAAAVLDALRLSLAERATPILTEFEAVRIRPGFCVDSADGRTLRARRVLLAPGSEASPKLGGTALGAKLLRDTGHALAPAMPALCPIRTDPARIRGLKGVRVKCTLSLAADGRVLRREVGEALFADDAVSGIAAMQLAGQAVRLGRSGKRAELIFQLDGPDPVQTRARLVALRNACPKRALTDYLTALLPKRLGQTLVKEAGLALTQPCDTLGDEQIDTLAGLLSGWRLPVRGVAGFDAAQVASGGATDQTVDPQTLESRVLPGLFLAGEALDVDGDCGGFNLQWAWASALAAAESAVASLAKPEGADDAW